MVRGDDGKEEEEKTELGKCVAKMPILREDAEEEEEEEKIRVKKKEKSGEERERKKKRELFTALGG